MVYQGDLMKNTNIIIKNAVNLARELNACAIIVFGDIPIEGNETSIPIYSISKNLRILSSI